MVCQLAYIPNRVWSLESGVTSQRRRRKLFNWRLVDSRLVTLPLGVVHAVGLAPTKSLGQSDLQSGAFAGQPRMQN